MRSLTLLALILTTFVHAGEPVKMNEAEIPSPEFVDALDNTPSACVGMIVLPNGETIEEFYKRNPETKTSLSEDSINGMKKNERLQKQAKTPEAVGGKKIEGDFEKNRRMIDGPANLRDAPNGKMIGTFPDGFYVLISGQKDDWFLVSGYWERECETGWTHAKNLKYVTREQIKELERQKNQKVKKH
jgi:hypothetical protein